MGAANSIIMAILLCIISAHEISANNKITLWHGLENAESIRILESKLKMFQEKTGIAVDVEYYGTADRAQNKIMWALSRNRAPDILWWGPIYTGQIAKTGKLVKVEDFFKNDKSFDADDIYHGLWDAGSYQGEIWTFPFSANNVALYYNKDHFKEANLNPTDLVNWDDLRKYAKKLTTGERIGLELSSGSGEWLTFSTLLPFIWQAGGEFLSRDEKKITFNTAACAEALTYLADLVQKDKCAKWSNPGLGYRIDDFIQGKVSMMICGPWQISALQGQDQIDYGAISMPTYRFRATSLGGEHLFLFKSNPKKEAAAWQACKFLASPDFQVDWAITSGYLPISRNATNHPRYKEHLVKNNFIKTFSDQMPFARARPSVPNYQRMSDEFSKAAMMVFSNKLPAGIALECAARKGQRHLE
jgi:multiple sugar transport system substrate-binding protein